MLFISLLSPRGLGKEAVNYLRKLKALKGITMNDFYVAFFITSRSWQLRYSG